MLNLSVAAGQILGLLFLLGLVALIIYLVASILRLYAETQKTNRYTRLNLLVSSIGKLDAKIDKDRLEQEITEANESR
jgi:Tfp pilus assembly protein PilN